MATRPGIVPVCERCRRRKQKCNNELVPCPSCVEAGLECVIADPDGERCIPRSYILQLEEHRNQLQAKLDSVMQSAQTDKTRSIRAQPPTPSNPGKYFGPCSSITLVEKTILLAQQQGVLWPGEERNDPQCSSIPISLLRAHLPAPTPLKVPPREILGQLYDQFSRLQWQYMILNRHEYDRHLDSFYSRPSSECPSSAIVAYMVLTTSLHIIGTNSGDMAVSTAGDGFNEESLALLIPTIARPSLDALQALLLVIFCSLMNPQKPLIWHLIGRAWRLALEMHLHTEDGCSRASATLPLASGTLPKRLFWALYSMDRVVGNTLGRPAMVCDDSITTTLPLATSNHADIQLTVATHLYRLRQMYSEVADMLYHRLRPFSAYAKADIQRRLEEWRAEIPHLVCENGIKNWFGHSYHNMCMAMYRPSPVVPHPSIEDMERCFEAASRVLELYPSLCRDYGIDSTWIAAHWLFVAGITHLFCLWSSAAIRSSVDWKAVNDTIHNTTMALAIMTERWRPGRRILSIYYQMSKETLHKYTDVSLSQNKDIPAFTEPLDVDQIMSELNAEAGWHMPPLSELDLDLFL